jgi:hypothetical protein
MHLRRISSIVLIVAMTAPVVRAQDDADAKKEFRTGLSQGGFSILAGEGEEFSRVVPDRLPIKSIFAKHGVGMDMVTINYEDSNGDPQALRVGGNGGDHETLLSLGTYDDIVSIEVKSGVRVDSITWVVRNSRTNKERRVKMGGDGGDRSTTIDVPSGHRVVGIYGRADSACLCKVGLVYVKK